MHEKLHKNIKTLKMEEKDITTLKSLCMHCGESGTTIIYPTHIPYFHEIIITSFKCDHCGNKNEEVIDAKEISTKGIKITLHCKTKSDINRQIIKTDKATIKIPELDFEIPPKISQISTIEGILTSSFNNLQIYQKQRFKEDYEKATKIQSTIDKLKEYANGNKQFTFILNDPSGKSFIQNPNAPNKDDNVIILKYERTSKENEMLGIILEEKKEEIPTENIEKNAKFKSTCFNCKEVNETRVCIVTIPKFKEVMIMVSDCNECGYKDTEIKPSGELSLKGIKVTLKVKGMEDLKRFLLKSESAAISIPEVNMKMEHGTLGGKYTTVEGILEEIKKSLKDIYEVDLGDSGFKEKKENIQKFFNKLEKFINCEEEFTLILDDPLGNVYIEEIETDDENILRYEEYERSWEQNEEFGLNDMKTEDY